MVRRIRTRDYCNFARVADSKGLILLMMLTMMAGGWKHSESTFLMKRGEMIMWKWLVTIFDSVKLRKF